MIYITGDTHGDFTRFSNKKLRQQGMELTEDAYGTFEQSEVP